MASLPTIAACCRSSSVRACDKIDEKEKGIPHAGVALAVGRSVVPGAFLLLLSTGTLPVGAMREKYGIFELSGGANESVLRAIFASAMNTMHRAERQLDNATENQTDADAESVGHNLSVLEVAANSSDKVASFTVVAAVQEFNSPVVTFLWLALGVIVVLLCCLGYLAVRLSTMAKAGGDDDYDESLMASVSEESRREIDEIKALVANLPSHVHKFPAQRGVRPGFRSFFGDGQETKFFVPGG